MKLLATNGPAASSPYAVLGLGDVAIPAFFVALMHALDRQLDQDASATAACDSDGASGGGGSAGGGVGGAPYTRNAVLAYAVGIGAAFYANEYVRRGQPALLYLVPAVLGSALLTARARGELDLLTGFEAPTHESQNRSGATGRLRLSLHA